jgi:hypothetical protein
MQWRVYLAGGGIVDDSSGVSSVPSTGFVCAVGYGPDGERTIMHGWPYYRYNSSDGQWWGQDFDGILQWAVDINVVVSVVAGFPTKFVTMYGDMDESGLLSSLRDRHGLVSGTMVSSEEWNETVTKAHKDPDFPQG